MRQCSLHGVQMLLRDLEYCYILLFCLLMGQLRPQGEDMDRGNRDFRDPSTWILHQLFSHGNCPPPRIQLPVLRGCLSSCIPIDEQVLYPSLLLRHQYSYNQSRQTGSYIGNTMSYPKYSVTNFAY